ncbi:hypothetical protein [Sphingobacterium sp. LRF_L2]|uniref:hypothetical protein n=1 Tax=Sphingobacterium sp. LRF_L2 TaxID=3369421 RepID=UPI003F61C544
MNNIKITILVLITILTFSCTKEKDRWIDVEADLVTEVVIDKPNARIDSFRVVSGGQGHVIYSAVNDSTKTITTYLPAFYQYNYLEVEIDLPDGATVSPSVDELVPVFPEEPVTFTVTASDGSSNTYTHITVVQQASLLLNEISSATTTTQYSNNFSAATITGSNFLPAYEVTRLYVVDAEGNKLWELNPGGIIRSYSITYVFSDANGNGATLEANTDYWFHLESYAHNVTMQYPFRIRTIQ